MLSVVATQYAAVLDAIEAKKEEFVFEEETISLIPTIGAWM